MTTRELTKTQPNAAAVFRKQTEKIAGSLLTSWVGDDRAKEATGRIAASLAASAAAARDPSDFYDCTPQSVATVVAVSALTGIMPSTGGTALAYAVPRRPRRNEKPQLQYMLSHRGINALARRSGQTMLAIPVSKRDQIEVVDSGEVVILNRDIDNPPNDYDDLRGVVVVVKEIASGRVTFSGFVAKTVIDKRRAMSLSGDRGPWGKWAVEMASKTAMHYAVGRGWIVIDDTAANRALSTDVEQDTRKDGDSVIDVARPSSIAAITLEPEPEPTPEPQPQAEPEPDGDTVANILLDRLDDVTDSAQLVPIGKAIGEHYLYAALKQIHRVVLQVEMLGDPVGFVRTLGTGVKDLFYLPAKAVVSSPRSIGKAEPQSEPEPERWPEPKP